MREVMTHPTPSQDQVDSMSETLEILKAARELIEERGNWMQGAYASDIEERCPLVPTDAGACKFCSVGAVARVLGMKQGTEAEDHFVVKLLDDLTSTGSIIDFNDNHTHPEVIQLFDKAIASLSTAEVSA